MQKKTFQRWNNIIHRDLGYFFVGMAIIYGLSGIALNHLDDWDPNYDISQYELSYPAGKQDATAESIKAWLSENRVGQPYKKHFYPNSNTLKIFLKSGSVSVDLVSGKAYVELLSRRPVFYEVNLLHYNPGKLWTIFSDFFAFSLILLALTGMFVLRGKNGLRQRGFWFVVAGVLIPVVLLINYL